MNQVGLGVDIVSIERMEQILSRTSNFASFTFTEDEIAYCNARANPCIHFATHFAAKEAVLKALGCGFLQGIGPKDVEVSHNNLGKPYIILHKKATEVSDSLGISSVPISLSYTHDEAIGIAIALKDEYAKTEESKALDITRELTAKFNEAKKLL